MKLPVWEFHARESIIQVILDDRGAGVNKLVVGDDTILLHLTGQEHTGGSHQEWVHCVQGVHSVESFEEYCCTGYNLLAQF